MVMYAKLAGRDALLIALALGVWWLLAGRSVGHGVVADFAGVLAGGMLGVVAFLLHEWGHWLGGLATRSRMQPARSLGSRFLFSYDARGNSLSQFLVMSLGGFAVTAALVWAYQVHLPDGLLATRVARGASLFLAFLGVTLELPLVFVAVWRGAVPAEATVKLAAPATTAQST